MSLGHPCPECWSPLELLYSYAAYRCHKCHKTFSYESFKGHQMLVEVFDPHKRFSAVISPLLLLLTGNMKGVVGKGHQHEGLQWERTNLKRWMDGK